MSNDPSVGPSDRLVLPVRDYDLDATLGSGQTFRWRRGPGGWTGVWKSHLLRLNQSAAGLEVTRLGNRGPTDDAWCAGIAEFLRAGEDLGSILVSFPDDVPLRTAVEHCRGLRLLRQEPWECLASFICSSTKQIVQIEDIVARLSQAFGEPILDAAGAEMARSFPRVERIAAATEAELRACKLGFRAPYLRGTAERVVRGELGLEALVPMKTTQARAALMECPGVGRKIADCVLLFAYGRQDAFPVDVWVRKALHRLYFPRVRKLSPRRLEAFSETHFGPNAGYAQQYLFHYVRTHLGRAWEG